MFKISGNKFVYYANKIICVIMTLVLVITVFSISAFAGEYTDSNRSKYHLANWYGLDELPYSDDSGVVYLKTYNGSKWVDLTICFDKCTPLSQFAGSLGAVSASTGIENAVLQNFVYSHIWGLQSGAVSNGQSFYLSCITDSPILYTYGNTGEDWKTLPWSYISQVVYTTQNSFSSGGSGEVDYGISNVRRYKTCYVYLNVDLGKYGFAVNPGYSYYCYSNKLMTNSLAQIYEKDGIELHAITLNVPADSKYSGTDAYNTAKVDIPYAFACYPSSECLRDWKRWVDENQFYLDFSTSLHNIIYNMDQELEQLMYISEDTYKIRELLEDISTGGKEYPSGGTLNDSSMSDQVDSIIGDISSDTSSANFIQTLSASFIVIRGLWDKIIDIFGLYGLIGLLLFLAFTAYLLGRALKGRSD